MNQHVKIATWHAVETRPAMEYVAETEIRRVGITVYLPQYRREYRHHRSKKWLARSFPLFTGYLFVRADDLDWGALAICRGLERNAVLRDPEGVPVRISDAEIAAIRTKEEAGEFDELRARSVGLHAGQEVTIAAGALAGKEALVARVKSGRNARLLLRMFGTEIAATVPVEKISKID